MPVPMIKIMGEHGMSRNQSFTNTSLLIDPGKSISATKCNDVVYYYETLLSASVASQDKLQEKKSVFGSHARILLKNVNDTSYDRKIYF